MTRIAMIGAGSIEFARKLELPVEACDTLTAGINHMARYLKFTHHGKDLYPRVWEKLDKERPIQLEQYRSSVLDPLRKMD